MNYSLNELDALCRKAARGAGLSWGLAEDAGRAARWLQARGLPGATCLLHALLAADASDDTCQGPGPSGAAWQASGGTLCPIIAGACLSDRALVPHALPVRFGPIRFPILLTPFAAAFSSAASCTLTLEWPGVRIVIQDDDAAFDGTAEGLAAPAADTATCAIVTATTTTTLPQMASRHSRAELATETYQGLAALAQRTYAPATEASRTAGAGAGMTDND